MSLSFNNSGVNKTKADLNGGKPKAPLNIPAAKILSEKNKNGALQDSENVKKKEKNMSKVAIFLADGFEEIEGLTVVDILRRAEINIDMISIMGRKEIHGSHGIDIMSDMLLEETDFSLYDMMVLPGGGLGVQNLKKCEKLMEVIKKQALDDKYVAAICAAPTFLGMIGLLEGKKACCYEGLENELTGAIVTKEKVTKDGKIITSRGMGTSIDFALALLEEFKGNDVAKDMAKRIML